MHQFQWTQIADDLFVGHAVCPAAARWRSLKNHQTGPFNTATAKLGLNINKAVSCFLPKGYVIRSSGLIYF